MSDPHQAPRVIAVVGPTASGKSSLADFMASKLDSEVISADSMQIYKGMDIGTAKTPVEERSVPYRCLDLVDPGQPYSVAQYQHEARGHVERLLAEGRSPVVCGGTGLYVRAALDAAFEFTNEGPTVATPHRRKFEDLADELGAQGVYDVLNERDPASAALIHPNNTRRVVRALEMHEAGESYAAQSANFSHRETQYPTTFIALEWPREVLYERCNARVCQMIDEGLVQEVERLLDAGFRDAVTAKQAIGYKELAPVIEGGKSLEEAVAEIQQATRRYAKRQLTWFRADSRIHWFNAQETDAQTIFDTIVDSNREHAGYL